MGEAPLDEEAQDRNPSTWKSEGGGLLGLKLTWATS